MNMQVVLQYVSNAAILANVGFAAFVAAVPPEHAIPWYMIAGFAAINAVVHALPSGNPPPVAK